MIDIELGLHSYMYPSGVTEKEKNTLRYNSRKLSWNEDS